MSARALLLALLIGSVGAAVQVARAPFEGADAVLQDAILARRTPESYLGGAADTARDPRRFITIVAIDERTIAELGAYNGGYPRAYHAQVIEQLLAAPPRVIALDLGFFEPTSDDPLLAAAFDHAASLPVPTTVILSAAGLPPADPTGELRFDRGLEPVPVFVRNTQIALANVVPDARGTIRSMPLVASIGGVERPTLGLAAVAAYLRRPTFMDARTSNAITVAGRNIPVDESAFMRISFLGPPSRAYGPESTFRVVSFVDVLRGRVDPSVWRGGLVFVGALGATGLADDYWTPASDQGLKMAGVEIHANAAATLFSTNFLQTTPWLTQAALVVGLAALLGLIAAQAGALTALVIAPLVLIAFSTAVVIALFLEGLLIPLALPLAVALSSFVAQFLPKLAADQRRWRATHLALATERLQDKLTGLASRTRLQADLDGAIRSGDSFGLVLLDLDNFKDVNDALGHDVGDVLLREVAARLVQVLGGTAASIARLGGDEFAAVVPLHGSSLPATELGAALLEALEPPIFVHGQALSLGASIGVALHPRDGANPETLLRHAEVAMYAAKRDRRGFALYSPDHDQRATERVGLAAALRQAILRAELRLVFQPKLSCRSGQVTGVEALVRWQHPNRGLLTPDCFIPLAEQTGLIGPLTRWVLEAATHQASLWMQAGFDQSLKIAVNLSPHDLQDTRLPVYVGQLLERYGVPPRMLSLELTEGALLADPERALGILEDLAARGIEASLDDFGTGYASFTYLQKLPVRELKIDASFVRDITTTERARAIVRSTIELGHQLGLTIVAEGVEDSATLQVLGELGCDQVQGFLFSRPVPGDELASWVLARPPLKSRRADAA